MTINMFFENNRDIHKVTVKCACHHATLWYLRTHAPHTAFCTLQVAHTPPDQAPDACVCLVVC